MPHIPMHPARPTRKGFKSTKLFSVLILKHGMLSLTCTRGKIALFLIAMRNNKKAAGVAGMVDWHCWEHTPYRVEAL